MRKWLTETFKKKIEIEIQGKNPIVYKTEISREMAESSGKCKELFSNLPIIWQNIEIFFSGFEVENRKIYITDCESAGFFSDEALRISYLVSERHVPDFSLAVSCDNDCIYAKAVSFSFLVIKEDIERLILAAIAKR